MARMIEVRKDLGSDTSIREIMEFVPKELPHEDIRVESEQYWEYGEAYHRVVVCWKREETANERLIRERADKLRREAAAEAQERRDQEEFVRLSKKYGTSV